MSINVNIKKRPPRFKGDIPHHNAVVSGPSLDFEDNKLRRFLEFQGLNPMSNNGTGLSVWSSRPQIGGAPYYIAHVLANKYGANINSKCRKEAMDIVNDRPDKDGIDHILGPKGAIPPGRRRLNIQASSTTFVANCSEDDKDRQGFLEIAGWFPIVKTNKTIIDRFGTKPYRTSDPFVANNLESFMSDGAKVLLSKMLKEASKNMRDSRSHDGKGAIDVPSPEGLEFLPFQRKGITMAMESPYGTLIADDMGLGKTMQGIGIINASKNIKKALVICQANMRVKWGLEIEKWKTNSDLSVGVAESSNFPDTNICVINYDILKKNIDALRAVEWDLIICDEAHGLKNPEAQRTKLVLGDIMEIEGEKGLPLSKTGKLIHLTGTPKPNRIEELWPLISSTRPDIWGKGPEAYKIFVNRYAPRNPIKIKIPPKFKGGREGEKIIFPPGEARREAELQLRLRGSGSFMRRMKRDNFGLPIKFRSSLDVPVRLSKHEKEMLRSAEFDLEKISEKIKTDVEIELGDADKAGAIIDKITSLNPDNPHFSEISRVRRNLGLIKAPHCAKFILDELEAEKDFAPENKTKTVVFAHHKDVIKTIYNVAETRMKGAFLVYDGSLSPKKKQAMVDRFQSDDNIRGIILSLAGNSGITLTQAARMRVVEPDWSPSNMIQIEDRIWRIGQIRNVNIGYMSVAGTLDARIGQSVMSKMQVDERSINTVKFNHTIKEQEYIIKKMNEQNNMMVMPKQEMQQEFAL